MVHLYNFEDKFIRVRSPHIADVLRNRCEYDKIDIEVNKDCSLYFTDSIPLDYNRWNIELPNGNIGLKNIKFKNLRNSLEFQLDLFEEAEDCIDCDGEPFAFNCQFPESVTFLQNKINSLYDIGIDKIDEDISESNECEEECTYHILDIHVCTDCTDCIDSSCCKLNFLNIPDYIVPLSIEYVLEDSLYEANFFSGAEKTSFIVGDEIWLPLEGANTKLNSGVYEVKVIYTKTLNSTVEDSNYIFIDTNKELLLEASTDMKLLHYSLNQATNTGCDYDKACTVYKTYKEGIDGDKCC